MEQILEKIQTNFECKTHKKTGVFYVSLLKDEPDPFYCLSCMNRRNNKDIKLLEMDDILKSDLKQAIYNWPPGITKEQIDFLADKSTDLIEEKLREDIMTFYDSLQSKLNSLIEESRKQQLAELYNTKFGSREALDFYNKQFKRIELTQIFQNMNVQSQDAYKQMLGSMIQSSPKDLEQLEKTIQEKKLNEVKFREFQDKNIQELEQKIISIIASLSDPLFNSNNSVGLLENYHFKKDNHNLSPELIQEQNLVYENDNLGSMSLLSKSMFLDSSCFNVQYGSQITNQKNKKSENIRSIFPINIKKKQYFELKFYDLKYLNSFNLGLTLLLNQKFDRDILFKDFWQAIVREVEDNKKNKSYFKFYLSFDLTKNQLKLTSNCFDGEKILKIDDYDKSKYQITFLFHITQDVSQFFIWNYKEID